MVTFSAVEEVVLAAGKTWLNEQEFPDLLAKARPDNTAFLVVYQSYQALLSNHKKNRLVTPDKSLFLPISAIEGMVGQKVKTYQYDKAKSVCVVAVVCGVPSKEEPVDGTVFHGTFLFAMDANNEPQFS